MSWHRTGSGSPGEGQSCLSQEPTPGEAWGVAERQQTQFPPFLTAEPPGLSCFSVWVTLVPRFLSVPSATLSCTTCSQMFENFPEGKMS